MVDPNRETGTDDYSVLLVTTQQGEFTHAIHALRPLVRLARSIVLISQS